MRNAIGFTLVELLVVVLIIGILAAIAVPNFVNAEGKSKTAVVKQNMHTIQVAVEAYATDSAGSYCSSSSGWEPYLPGGSMSINSGTHGTIPQNPISGTTSTIGSGLVSNVQAARSTVCGNFGPGAGNLSYDSLMQNSTYGVCGGDSTGVTVGYDGFMLVLSNQ
jgi:prepilin-type N-terminal cleavage/methylation domain-containing protein